MHKILLLTALSFVSSGAAFAADALPTAKPTNAKSCISCHKAEQNIIRGSFDSVAFKSKTIQLKVDDAVHLLKFDEDDIKVVNKEGKTGDGELLKNNKVARGHAVSVEYVEKDGVKTAVKLIEKPPVKISEEMLMKTEDLQKLVAKGPAKGKYYLFDSRPVSVFQEGFIPSATSLPFSDFDTLAPQLLPADKNALIIFYCGGPTCNLSPGSAAKAKALGYTNLKVYKDGMPAWLKKNAGLISAQFLKKAWFDKDLPHVVLDVRTSKDASKGHIKGAVAFPLKQSDKLIKGLDLKQDAPIMVYDRKGGKDAESVALKLVKAGYTKVLVVNGGFEGWLSAKNEIQKGKLSAKVLYVPKPRAGEINFEEFQKYLVNLPSNVMIIDVRNSDEVKSGMLKTAKAIPAEELKNRAAEIPKDKLIVTHCATGVRAEMAYHALKEMGYTNVKFVNAKFAFEKDGSYKISKD